MNFRQIKLNLMNTSSPKVSTIICIVAAIIIFVLATFQISLVQDVHSLRIKQNQQKNFSHDQARKNCRYRGELIALVHEQDKVMREAIIKLHKELVDVKSVNEAQCEVLMELHEELSRIDSSNEEQCLAVDALFTYLSELDVWDMQTVRANHAHQKILPNIVSMKGEYRGPFGERCGTYGTGFFIDNKHILTVGHISEALIDGTERAILHDNTEIDVELVAEEVLSNNDLALFRIDPNDANDYNVSNITFSTDVPLAGETLFMIGSPFGYNNTLAVGAFSRLVRGGEIRQPCIWNCDIYLEDVLSDGGSSGSPVFNAEYEVVSIHTGCYSKYAVSIPAYTIVKFLKDNGVYSGYTSATSG